MTAKPANSGQRPNGDGEGKPSPDLLVDPFHAIALWAYMAVAAETGQWPPDAELTRRRAYDLYESEKRKDSGNAS